MRPPGRSARRSPPPGLWGMPGPSSATTTRTVCDPSAAVTVRRVSGGVCWAAFSKRFTNSLRTRSPSTWIKGSEAGTFTWTARGARSGRLRSRAAPTISSREFHSRRGFASPLWRRVMSSRFCTWRFRRIDSWKIVSASSPPSPRSTRALAAPAMEVRGCAGRGRSRRGERCGCAPTRPGPAPRATPWRAGRAPGRGRGRWRRSPASRARQGPGARRPRAGGRPGTPIAPAPPRSGRYSPRDPGSVSVPRPAGSSCSRVQRATASSSKRLGDGESAPSRPITAISVSNTPPISPTAAATISFLLRLRASWRLRL